MKTTRASVPRRSGRSAVVRRAPPPIPFKAFIAYADLNAARQAMKTIAEVLCASGHPYQLEPMLWRFDQLGAEKWHEAAIADAAQANVVVLASSAAGALPCEIEQWVSSFLARKRGARTTLVALLGYDDAWTISIEGPAVACNHDAPIAAAFPAQPAMANRAA